MRPASGRYLPVMMLINVVLPAPLGPIRPRRSPGSIRKDNLSSTGAAPKLLQMPSSSRIGASVMAPPRHFAKKSTGQSGDAARKNQHEPDEDEAHPKLPVLGERGEPVRAEDIDRAADQRTPEPRG